MLWFVEVEVGVLRREVASKDVVVEEKRRLTDDLLHVQNDLSLTRSSLQKQVEDLEQAQGQNSWLRDQLQVDGMNFTFVSISSSCACTHSLTFYSTTVVSSRSTACHGTVVEVEQKGS